MNHARHRVYSCEFGRWTRRDPASYKGGTGLYQYFSSRCSYNVDWNGLLPPDPPPWWRPDDRELPTICPVSPCPPASDPRCTNPGDLLSPCGPAPQITDILDKLFPGKICNYSSQPVIIWSNNGSLILNPGECTTEVFDADWLYIPGTGWLRCRGGDTCKFTGTPDGFTPYDPSNRDERPGNVGVAGCDAYCRAYARSLGPPSCTDWTSCMIQCTQFQVNPQFPPCPFANVGQ
jgi:hypothetical protein